MKTDPGDRRYILAVLRTHAYEHGSAEQVVAADELERLWAIVDNLPKTADGVPIVPGMGVWRIEHQTALGETVMDVSRLGVHLSGKSDLYFMRDVCSTREAAEAAGKEK